MRFCLKFAAGILVFLALVFSCLRIFSDFKAAEAERIYPPQGDFVQAENLRIHYVRKGTGRPVILIHGSFGSVNDFTFSIFQKASESYDVTAFDRPGHGYSQRPSENMTIFDHARILHESVNALGIQRPVVAGHSLGGAVALAYALDYPEDVSALVMLAGYVTPYEGLPRIIHRAPAWPVIGKIYLNALVEPIGIYLQGQIAKRVFSSGSLPLDYLETAAALARRPSHFRANAEDIRNLPGGLDSARARLSELKMPVMYLAGDADQIAPKERHADSFKTLVPAAEIIVIPGGGHQPSFTAPDKVMEVLDLAWRRTEEAAAILLEPSANPPESTESPER